MMEEGDYYSNRIDSRIMQICNDAERDYVQTKAGQQSNRKKNDYMYIETNDNPNDMQRQEVNKRIVYNDPIQNTQKSDRLQLPYNKIELAPTQVSNQSYHSIKFNGINKKSIMQLPITVKRSYNSNSNNNNNTSQRLQFQSQSQQLSSSLQKPIVFTKEHIQDINKSIKMKTSSRNANPMNLSKSISSSFNSSSSFPKSSPSSHPHPHPNPNHHYHHRLISKHSCIACDLQNKMKSSIYHVELNKKILQNTNINKLLLDAKRNISIKQYQVAYDLLSIPINQGLYHADLFYLYGDVCRLMKRMEEAEDYLLLSLNLEHHSPYVFYSLGMLYQEVTQLKYSNNFLKKFNNVHQTADVHYELARNYYAMGKYLKAADQLTKAIHLDGIKGDYYTLRAEVYSKIGLDDLANEDHSKIQGCR